MTPQELKNSILQLAVQGKLVEQRAEEGTAEELYKKIQAEKQKLIAEKKIKKEKPLLEITAEEIPFDIPESWKWVRLGEVLSNKSGLSYKKNLLEIKSESMIRVLRGGNISGSKFLFKDDDVFISSEFVKTDLFLVKNTLITPAVTSLENIGKIARIDKDLNDTVVGGFVLMLNPYYDNDILSNCLLYILSSKFIRDNCRKIVNKSGQAFYNLSREKFMQLLVPLPPLEEQKRIVAKIEELLPQIDRYEKAWSKLEEFNKLFPDDMQKSILQYAVQGKLVEQRAEEGTAEELYKKIQAEKQKLIEEKKIKKEKPLPEITAEEIPFEIPESWQWVRIGEVFSHNTGKALNSAKTEGTKLTYITTSNLYWNRFELDKLKEMYFTDDEVEKYTVKKGDLLVCEGGDIGRSAVWNYDEDMRIQNHIHKLRPYLKVNVQFFSYVFYLYKAMGLIGGKGIGIKGLSSNAIHIIKIPLPPLEEQKRIVAKIEELLPLCERLKEDF